MNEWVAFQLGLPVSARIPVSEAFQSVDLALADWLKNKKIETSEWSTQEWLHFLRGLPRDLGAARMRRLDTSWRLTDIE